MITLDNFQNNTSGIFMECAHPMHKPCFISKVVYHNRLPYKSVYWYGKDEGGEYVIRKSNHWCKIKVKGQDQHFRQLKKIKHCKWDLKVSIFPFKSGKAAMGTYFVGKVYVKHLRHYINWY